MGLTASAAKSDFKPAPIGMHPARCYQVIDLGTQQTEWLGEIKARHELNLVFELLGEDKRDDDKPFVISKKFTLSLNEKSALRPFLESWRGKPFTPEELDGFDITKLLGAKCNLNIVHAESNNRTYANIAAITPLMKGQQMAEPVNDNLVFNLDTFDQEAFDKLPEFIRKKVSESFEYRELFPGESPEKFDGDKPVKEDVVIEDIGDEPINLDDIPF